jgi:hypothetical protein
MEVLYFTTGPTPTTLEADAIIALQDSVVTVIVLS